MSVWWYISSQKNTDQNANPFVVVIMAYVIGIAACVVGYFLFPRQDTELMPMMKTVIWTALGIGLGSGGD